MTDYLVVYYDLKEVDHDDHNVSAGVLVQAENSLEALDIFRNRYGDWVPEIVVAYPETTDLVYIEEVPYCHPKTVAPDDIHARRLMYID